MDIFQNAKCIWCHELHFPRLPILETLPIANCLISLLLSHIRFLFSVFCFLLSRTQSLIFPSSSTRSFLHFPLLLLLVRFCYSAKQILLLLDASSMTCEKKLNYEGQAGQVKMITEILIYCSCQTKMPSCSGTFSSNYVVESCCNTFINNGRNRPLLFHQECFILLKDQDFCPGRMVGYCRGLVLVANTGISTLGFNHT